MLNFEDVLGSKTQGLAFEWLSTKVTKLQNKMVAIDALGIGMLLGVFFVMAGFSCSINLQTFISYLKHPKGIVIGILCQFGILPLSAFLITKLLSLSPLHGIALIITASCPGGTLSNFWCWFFGVDLSLSIAMTTFCSLSSFLFLTINCLLYISFISDDDIKIDYISLMISVFALIIGVVVGLVIAYKNYTKLKKPLYIIGGISVFVLIVAGAYQNNVTSSVSMFELESDVYIAATLLNIIAWFVSLFVSYFVFRLDRSKSMSVAIESSNQNVGLAIPIVLLTFTGDNGDIAVGVPMLYGAMNGLFILLLGTIFRITGFIQKDNDGNYERSGVTKCVKYCSNDKNQRQRIDSNLELTNQNTKLNIDAASTPLSLDDNGEMVRYSS